MLAGGQVRTGGHGAFGPFRRHADKFDIANLPTRCAITCGVRAAGRGGRTSMTRRTVLTLMQQ